MDNQQLLIETYVDAYLDEVEIRQVFIQEWSSPLSRLLQKLERQLGWYKKETEERRVYYYKKQDEWYEANQEYQRSPKKAIDKKILDHYDEAALQAAKDHSKAARKVKAHRLLIQTTKQNPTMLGNVPDLFFVVGAGVILAAISYGAYRIYKKFFGKAARACKDKKGKVKTVCMIQYQIKGLEASKKPIANGLRGCSKAKDTQICKAKFNSN